MLSFPVLTHKKSQRAKERCSHLILEIETCIWDQPTPLPLGKPSSNCRALQTEQPAASLGKLAEGCHPLHSHLTQLWSSISPVTLWRFQGTECRIPQILTRVVCVRGSIWPRAHHWGLQVTCKCTGWCVTSRNRSSRGTSGSQDLYTGLTPGGAGWGKKRH